MYYTKQALFSISENFEYETTERRKPILMIKQDKSHKITSKTYRRWARKQRSLLEHKRHKATMDIRIKNQKIIQREIMIKRLEKLRGDIFILDYTRINKKHKSFINRKNKKNMKLEKINKPLKYGRFTVEVC